MVSVHSHISIEFPGIFVVVLYFVLRGTVHTPCQKFDERPKAAPVLCWNFFHDSETEIRRFELYDLIIRAATTISAEGRWVGTTS